MTTFKLEYHIKAKRDGAKEMEIGPFNDLSLPEALKLIKNSAQNTDGWSYLWSITISKEIKD